MKKLEIIVGDKTLIVDKFTQYGYEKNFFADVKGDLYYKQGNDNYGLLKKDYMEKTFQNKQSISIDEALYKMYEYKDHEPYISNDKLEID